ncbi:MAG TPA: hypothetical protein VMA71_02590, partial [Alloacidobacterium sp.]|nr:hypothetical protein [Alloacidobacterium sp.]
MKQDFRRMVALGAVLVGLAVACKREPTPPTEADAIAVWNNVHRRAAQAELVSLKKTNGQMATVNGVRVYTLYYTATDKAIKD